MRVALVLYGNLDLMSGGFLYDRMLVDFLRSRGEEVEVVSLSWPPYLRGLWDNLAPGIRRRLEGVCADVMLQDELAHPSLFWHNRGLKGRRAAPVVAIVHHLRSSEARPAWQNHWCRLVERLYLTSVHGFIFNSRSTKKTVEDLVGDGKPSVVAYPGADRFDLHLTHEEIAARAREPGPLRLVFLGNVIPRKGLHTLLDALACLPLEGWRLTVAGSLTAAPAYVRQVKDRISQQGWASRVTFTGILSEEEVASCLARSHVLAVPSSYEGFGIAYLEGMAFGLPALATTAGGASEIITRGQDGFLTAPDDVAALTGHLRTLMEDRDRLAAMSLAALARFASHPTWEEGAATIHRFLQSLVS